MDNADDYLNVYRKSSIFSCAVDNLDEAISLLSDQLLGSFENDHISNRYHNLIILLLNYAI